MMSTSSPPLPDWALIAMTAANFAVCSAIGLACLCRIAVMTRETVTLHFRLGYALLLGAATISGWEWLVHWLWAAVGIVPNVWSPHATLGQIALASTALFVLGWGRSNWASGPPEYARSDAAPLVDLPPGSNPPPSGPRPPVPPNPPHVPQGRSSRSMM